MPLYLCNAAKGAISDEAKPKIAADITRIHCDVTGAPPQFVHAFFVEEDAAPPLDGKSATHAGIDLDAIGMMTTDVPASWAFEGGEVMPEPGEEAEWLARHQQPTAAE